MLISGMQQRADSDERCFVGAGADARKYASKNRARSPS
jgi:hypothetical protein